jgi:hypothetical protein
MVEINWRPDASAKETNLATVDEAPVCFGWIAGESPMTQDRGRPSRRQKQSLQSRRLLKFFPTSPPFQQDIPARKFTSSLARENNA